MVRQIWAAQYRSCLPTAQAAFWLAGSWRRQLLRKEEDTNAANSDAAVKPKGSSRAVAPALERQHTGSSTGHLTGSLRAQYGSRRLDGYPHLRRQLSRTQSMLANYSVRNPQPQYRRAARILLAFVYMN